MSEHDEPTMPKPAFALLTVTTRPEGPENTVGLSFHTGSAPRGACSPEVACHIYEEQAPILALRQGSTHVSITPAAPRNVGAADVRFAKALVDSALRYYQAVNRAQRTQGRAALARE
ncbi:hypothetical protein ABZ249_11905 [Nocardiopsis sp. NPDC006139]|uniref:hypothetical protein n=1 Tax=Nocardiopsis sp. NPDC006139 TaxID=3154578 RepID=UPI0033A63A0A